MSFRKRLEKGRILRAASLAEIGGVVFIGDNWVDWTFYFICIFGVCQLIGFHCVLLLTLMVLDRGMTHVLYVKGDRLALCKLVGLLCGYG